MSRGHGSKQRLILQALELYGPFYLEVLAEGDFKTSYKAFHRAALRLEADGLLEIGSYTYGQPKVFVSNRSLANRKSVPLPPQFAQFGNTEGITTFAEVNRADVEAATKQVRTLLVRLANDLIDEFS